MTSRLDINRLRETEQQALAATSYPNPTRENFALHVTGGNLNLPINIQVVDAFGRMIEQKTLPGQQLIYMGQTYKPGIYVVKIVQGSNRTQLKIVKL